MIFLSNLGPFLERALLVVARRDRRRLLPRRDPILVLLHEQRVGLFVVHREHLDGQGVDGSPWGQTTHSSNLLISSPDSFVQQSTNASGYRQDARPAVCRRRNLMMASAALDGSKLVKHGSASR